MVWQNDATRMTPPSPTAAANLYQFLQNVSFPLTTRPPASALVAAADWPVHMFTRQCGVSA